MTDKAHQPRLVSEPEASYQLSPEEEARKAVYRERLREYLQDPEFRATPGFPIADDEAILALSDPPYYTACPNPFLPEIIAEWQAERGETENDYHREPFASDVSEGKNNPIYNAHSYHTKVPHPAIMRYILHYTKPGDIVFDGFAGTGMTGVAAQLCGDRAEVEKLGYRIDEEGNIYDPAQSDEPISKLGARKVILNDLSPAATFIAYNYNTPVDATVFEREANRVLQEVEEELGWMYETLHTDGKTKGKINYTVWSDVFACPQCGEQMVFWDVAVDQDAKKMRTEWPCPSCDVTLSKTSSKESSTLRVERAFETKFDFVLNETIRQAKQVPVLINYSVGKKRHEKRSDAKDLNLIEEISKNNDSYHFPNNPIKKGDKTGDPFNVGITHIHHFYTHRNLLALITLWNKISSSPSNLQGKFAITAANRYLSRLSKLGITYYFSKGGGVINAGISGTLFVPSFSAENNVLRTMSIRIPKLTRVFKHRRYSEKNYSCISTQSSNQVNLPPNSLDYIFVDPPFGSNLMYSELNFLWEAWLNVLTNNHKEAIINKTQRKGLPEYTAIMETSFREFYRVLKPGHWMTVEFHNSKNAVWNGIQEALLRAGFMVADVRSIDKQQGTFNQVTASGAVKQDLIISAYKPAEDFEKQFLLEAGNMEGAWAFVRQHLVQLPVVVRKEGLLEPVSERQAYLLFDRMVAFHIQRGFTVPLSAAEFYAGLLERFPERDSMYFLPDQAPEYDRARLESDGIAQLSLFVNDEKSAIQWMRQQLDPKQAGTPQAYQEIQPEFLKQLRQQKHEVLPELADLLEENFLEDDNGRWYVPDPAKAGDLEKLRLKALLREFKTYIEGEKRLRQFRTEAVRAGFAEAYKERNWQVILKVAERLPVNVLQEDPDLLMYYDAAALRAE
jgi:predicted RNA-binding Zn-ribbon protein involved in translation (DUF1610 family)